MSTVNLVRVFRKDVETKYGIKPKVSIQTKEHGDKWLSTFKTRGTEGWEEGMEVQVNVSEKGDFLNFDPVGGSAAAYSPSKGASDLEPRVAALEKAVFGEVKAEVAVETLDEEFDTGF